MFNNVNENPLCQPPDCPEGFRITILKYGPPNCNFISWKIENIYNVNYTVIDSKVLYSINDQKFNNSENGQFDGINYYALLDLNETDGILYFKIRMEINNDFYESELKEFSLLVCEQYVKAMAVDETCNNIVWVKKSSILVPDDIIYGVL